jgi:hypothetical protein
MLFVNGLFMSLIVLTYQPQNAIIGLASEKLFKAALWSGFFVSRGKNKISPLRPVVKYNTDREN